MGGETHPIRFSMPHFKGIGKLLPSNILVHKSHCCLKHGCKYGKDSTCPVTTEQLTQNYPCEDCDEDERYNNNDS